MATFPQPGSRRTPVTFQQPVKSRDSTGGVVITWETYCRRFCNVEQMSGTEVQNAGERQSTTIPRLRTRYDPITSAITNQMRMSFDQTGQIFEINSVLIDYTETRQILVTAKETPGAT